MKIAFTKLPKTEGLPLDYQFYKTALGNLLIVSWKNHLVYIAFAHSPKEALVEAKEYFLKSAFHKKTTPIQKKVVAYITNPKNFDHILSIALKGTPFQVRVWMKLARIAFGKTCFYSDIAKMLKQPTAVRAVASAVAKNPLAIILPCHRVLPRSGGIGKYHWGPKNKKALLIWESLAGKKEGRN